MQELYGTDPADLITAIGPSICQDCYEVSEDVIDRFKEVYEPSLWPEIFRRGRVIDGEKPEQKYQLDLWAACRATMIRCGVKAENIAMANLCTCCNADVMHSHRATAGKRGELCAFLMLKED